MRALHLFFQLHQPYSLKAPEGGEHEYFGGGADFREANQKYYQPFFALLERNTQRYSGLKVSLLVSGTWLDQAELYEPDLVRRLQKLVDLKQVELVATPYYYSLSAFYDKDEFAEQMALFRQKFEGKFSTKCQVFAAPGLMYHDKLAKWAEKTGLQGALAGDGAGVLGFRNAGKVYDAAGCEDFRVLFENGRLSQALARGGDLVMAESAPTAEDFAEVETGVDSGMERLEIPRGAAIRKRATAAEFVRGRAGATQARATVSAGARKVRQTGKKMYSAKKLQKELDIASLRGNLISLCLDARMFGAHREEGVVACFDEFFMNWLKVPGNKFLTASEVFETPAFAPTEEISVKSTVRTRGLTEDFEVDKDEGLAEKAGSSEKVALEKKTDSEKLGLARMEEVQYTLPEGLQVSSEDKLYGLRARVLKTKNEDLWRDFQKLTTMDYAFGKFREDFEKVLEDFEAQIDELLPKPKQLKAENDGQADEDMGEAKLTASRAAAELHGVTGDEEPEPEDDYTVKVHRILKKASAERQARPARPEDFELESGDSDDTDEFDEDFADEAEGWEDAQEADLADEFENDTVDADDEDEDMMDAFDAAEAEVQVIAQRMKRSRQTAERELEALMEAEVVSVESVGQEDGEDFDDEGLRGEKVSEGVAGTKKKKMRRRIVLD